MTQITVKWVFGCKPTLKSYYKQSKKVNWVKVDNKLEKMSLLNWQIPEKINIQISGIPFAEI